MAKRQQLAKKEHKKRKKPEVESHLHRGMYVCGWWQVRMGVCMWGRGTRGGASDILPRRN